MSTYCEPCKRSFKGQRELDQHIRDSSAHNKPSQTPSQVQGPRVPQVKLPPVMPKQQVQASRSRVKPVKPQQVLNARLTRIHTATERNHGQPPIAVASGSSTPQIMMPAVKATPQVAKSSWSVIAESEYMTVFDELSAHCHSPKELEDNNYIIRPYDPLHYANSRKCKRCKGQESKVLGRECTYHLHKRNKWNPSKPYKCCSTGGRGCMTLPKHDFQLPLRAIKHKDYRQTPTASAEPKLRAVVLDCEMAGIAGGDSEVILLCVTDYVTGAVLLNRFVCPRTTITQMRSSIHGITKSMLNEAISQGQALSGWEGARSELWKYINDNTILIGHALEHDLDALRIIHPRVVDSGILSRNAVGIRRIRWGLHTLCSELLNIEIRKNKGGIHDCLEDVLATREVVLFCTQNKEGFKSWAKATESMEIHLEMEREIARQKKENQRVRKDVVKVGGGSNSRTYYKVDDEDEEVLHWSDIAEDIGWPHPDTGYDPWSD
ncbi:ribonuclease H-like domain-containing protein [Xylariaceae sp. AK1471]|nr:ribonuclease H-like domain-containing protein [Xylariaceae sp. AK1471]